jgi:taspase (threonine aspartase 1)
MFVAIHAGAGFHSPKEEKHYRQLTKKVVKKTLEFLETGASAVEGVTMAIRLLEEDARTNAGISGCNMTIDGRIEADAAIMDLDCFTSIGAVPMTTMQCPLGDVHPSPISIVSKLQEYCKQGVDLAGRQPPVFLVGDACHLFAHDAGMDMISGEDARGMITSDQLDRYYRHMGILKEAYEGSEFHDTVGAIVIDSYCHIATGVSSGGISLKKSGRVGEAAVPGAGIWIRSDSTATIATSISGTGEQIMKTQLASRVCDADAEELLGPALAKIARTHFLNARMLNTERQKHMGALVVRMKEQELECGWVHTTPSFCIGFGSATDSIHFHLSRKAIHQDLTVSSHAVHSLT